MSERQPIPINRGIEIQKEKINELVTWAIAKYKELSRLSEIVEERIDRELAQTAVSESNEGLPVLFEQKHALEEVGRELESMILRNFEHLDDLQARWLKIDERMSAAQWEIGD